MLKCVCLCRVSFIQDFEYWEGRTSKFGIDMEGSIAHKTRGGSGNMLPQNFFFIDALGLIDRHSGSTSSQF